MKQLPAVVETPEALPPEVLSAALSLDGATVRGVHRGEVWRGGWSIVYQLLLDWDPSGAGPSRLVLKVPRPEVAPATTARNARQEYRFYAELAALTPLVPTLTCYAGAHDATRGTYCLLLEDISATYAPPSTKPVPPPEQARAAVALLARLHASWWQDPRLGNTIGAPRPDAAALDTIRGNNQRAAAAFLDFMGDALPESRRRALRRIAAFVPELVARQAAGPATLLHRDPQWGNFLFPLHAPPSDPLHDPPNVPSNGLLDAPPDGQRAPVLLFDWQTWDAGAPAADLAYMIARHWSPEPNLPLVEDLLRHYHQSLTFNGVSAATYPWSRCWEDFRLAVARTPMAIPMGWSDWGAPTDDRASWARRTERASVLFDALDCTSLIS